MNYFYTSRITIWMLIAIINLNVSSVISKLVVIHKRDPPEWREYGAQANFAQFNSMYAISINEELLRSDKFSTGKCHAMDSQGAKSAQNLSYPNQCAGSLHSCWLHRESEERKKAEEDIKNSLRWKCIDMTTNCHKTDGRDTEHYRNIRDHTGNICKCLCLRDDISNSNNERGKLLDSICYDVVSVDDGYVATGARFKRHGNVIHLELQQGLLSEGRIDPATLKWTTSNNCKLKARVVKAFPIRGTRISFIYTSEIRLEDLTFSENAVVTGVKLFDSLRGRYIDYSGNIIENEYEIFKKSQCHGRASPLIDSNSDLLPSTYLIGHNYERSRSCNHKIFFKGTSKRSDNTQHIVPYVDLQEVVTDQNSPKPIHGIGWYYRGHPGYGGFLALKIFTKK